MRNIIYIIGVMLLLAACGQRQQAKSVVKGFVEQQLQKEVSYLDFSDIDSTRAISDSLIDVLRQRAGQNVQYQSRTGHTLLYIRAKYLLDKDTLSTTFYLDPQLTGVVAFKQN